jgi:tripartite-type tricarboxylate transporter receptor subunit TctC
MFNRKHIALAAVAALAINGAVGAASAQSWPTRPVTMVVPFAAGSSSDTAGRVLAVGLSEALAQQVIIENVGGGGGMTGTARVAKAAPDGYQFVFASVDSMAIVPAMHKQPLYNSVTDFTAAGLVDSRSF